MKNKIIIAIIALGIGIAAGLTIAEKITFAEELKAYETAKNALPMIERTRKEVVTLNQKYNYLLNVSMKEAMKGDKEFYTSGVVLQELTKELINVNKSLHIDCYAYGDNGKPLEIEGEDGNYTKPEIVPNELKILE